MTCCTDRAMWTGEDPGTIAYEVGARSGIGAVADRHGVMAVPGAFHSLR